VQGDLAIVAQVSFKRAQESGELGHDLEKAREAKEIFSGSAGREATAGYFTLLELGERHPDAVSFQDSSFTARGSRTPRQPSRPTFSGIARRKS
jgi:hypothetical protein